MLNMRNAAIAAIISASLSLLAMSVAQAQGGEKKPTHKALYNTTQNAPMVNRATPRWTGHSTWNSRGRREAGIIMVRTAAKRLSRKALDLAYVPRAPSAGDSRITLAVSAP